jgi:hypothetical protein
MKQALFAVKSLENSICKANDQLIINNNIVKNTYYEIYIKYNKNKKARIAPG